MRNIKDLLEEMDKVANIDSMEDETGTNEIVEEYNADNELGLYIINTRRMYDKYCQPALDKIRAGKGDEVDWKKIAIEGARMYAREIEPLHLDGEGYKETAEYLKDYYTNLAGDPVNEDAEIEPGDFYDIAVKELPAEDIDHHESDLYIRKTPKSTELINRLKYKDANVSTFRSNIEPHDIWYDLPFCYIPHFEERQKELQRDVERIKKNYQHESVDVDMQAFLDKFNAEYKFLYDNEDNVAGADEAVDAFDGDMTYPKFKQFVQDFVQFRGDFISSDREAAAFEFACESFGLFNQLLEEKEPCEKCGKEPCECKMNEVKAVEPTPEVKAELERIKGEIEKESISYGEIAYLQDHQAEIRALDDIELAQWAGIPEEEWFSESVAQGLIEKLDLLEKPADMEQAEYKELKPTEILADENGKVAEKSIKEEVEEFKIGDIVRFKDGYSGEYEIQEVKKDGKNVPTYSMFNNQTGEDLLDNEGNKYFAYGSELVKPENFEEPEEDLKENRADKIRKGIHKRVVREDADAIKVGDYVKLSRKAKAEGKRLFGDQFQYGNLEGEVIKVKKIEGGNPNLITVKQPDGTEEEVAETHLTKRGSKSAKLGESNIETLNKVHNIRKTNARNAEIAFRNADDELTAKKMAVYQKNYFDPKKSEKEIAELNAKYDGEIEQLAKEKAVADAKLANNKKLMANRKVESFAFLNAKLEAHLNEALSNWEDTYLPGTVNAIRLIAPVKFEGIDQQVVAYIFKNKEQFSHKFGYELTIENGGGSSIISNGDSDFANEAVDLCLTAIKEFDKENDTNIIYDVRPLEPSAEDIKYLNGEELKEDANLKPSIAYDDREGKYVCFATENGGAVKYTDTKEDAEQFLIDKYGVKKEDIELIESFEDKTVNEEEKTYYLYAGYYELYLTDHKLTPPYMYQAENTDLNQLINDNISEIDDEGEWTNPDAAFSTDSATICFDKNIIDELNKTDLFGGEIDMYHDALSDAEFNGEDEDKVKEDYHIYDLSKYYADKVMVETSDDAVHALVKGREQNLKNAEEETRKAFQKDIAGQFSDDANVEELRKNSNDALAKELEAKRKYQRTMDAVGKRGIRRYKQSLAKDESMNEVEKKTAEENNAKRQFNSLKADLKAEVTGDPKDQEEADKLANKATKSNKQLKSWKKAKYGESADIYDIVRKKLLGAMRGCGWIELNELQKQVKAEGLDVDKKSLANVAETCLKYSRLYDAKDLKNTTLEGIDKAKGKVVVLNGITMKVPESMEEVVARFDEGKHEIVKCSNGYYNRYNIKDGKARFTTKCVESLPTALGALKKRFPQAEEVKEEK